jgi:hypothetical protein
LRMILECTATKRFHPHPEDWIYTVRVLKFVDESV